MWTNLIGYRLNFCRFGLSWRFIAPLLLTCKMIDRDPLAWRTLTLERITHQRPSAELDALMPWNNNARTASTSRLQLIDGLQLVAILSGATVDAGPAQGRRAGRA